MKDDPDLNNHNNNSNTSNSLNREWSLLMDSFVDVPDALAEHRAYSVDEIKINKKMLSQKRHDMHRGLEEIKNRIDQLGQVSENLVLVGSDPEDVQTEIQKLYLEGEKLHTEIQQIENQIKKIHEVEENL